MPEGCDIIGPFILVMQFVLYSIETYALMFKYKFSEETR
jgi:hypothetical protein